MSFKGDWARYPAEEERLLVCRCGFRKVVFAAFRVLVVDWRIGVVLFGKPFDRIGRDLVIERSIVEELLDGQITFGMC